MLLLWFRSLLYHVCHRLDIATLSIKGFSCVLYGRAPKGPNTICTDTFTHCCKFGVVFAIVGSIVGRKLKPKRNNSHKNRRATATTCKPKTKRGRRCAPLRGNSINPPPPTGVPSVPNVLPSLAKLQRLSGFHTSRQAHPQNTGWTTFGPQVSDPFRFLSARSANCSNFPAIFLRSIFRNVF